jgi:hypothetical protein
MAYEAFLWHRYQHIDAFRRSEDKWDLDKDPINSSKNQELLKGVDQKWTFTGANGESISASASRAEAPPAPRRYSLQFFLDRMLKPSAWNRAIAFGLLALIGVAFIRPAGVPRILLLLPLAIWLMSFIPNWGLRCSSIYRYETAGIPLFVVIAVWLSAPSRRPLLISLGAIAFVVQLYYAFLFSRGFWIG